MVSLHSLSMFLPSVMPDLTIPDITAHYLIATATCVGIAGLIARACLPKPESSLPLPPSPPTWRLWGHFLPPKTAFLATAGWIDEYGPLITIRSGREKIVIIGRHNAAMDIMEKQGGSVNDRPRMIAAEIFTGGLSVLFAPPGDMFRRMRKALRGHFNPEAAEAYQPLHVSHAKNAVLNILEDPYNFQNHALTYAAVTIMKITYGKISPTSATDPEVMEVRRLFMIFRKVVSPGAYLVDTIPWLKYFPWYGRELRGEFEKRIRRHTKQLERVKQQISDVNAGRSFARYMLENDHLHGLHKDEMAFLAASSVGAGTETTAAVICTVMMAAACFPEEQAKVHAELDAVIGRHRAPTPADQPYLPRLQAFISEALRWRPVSPNGMPHRTTRDVIWENYCIPAGTTVVGNHWAICRDPEYYPEPHTFNPQRWIDDQDCLRGDLKLPLFGFGRRTCPGLHIANRSVFVNLLLVLWAFELTPDSMGPLDDMGFTNGIPDGRPYSINFKTRIPEMELRRMIPKSCD